MKAAQRHFLVQVQQWSNYKNKCEQQNAINHKKKVRWKEHRTRDGSGAKTCLNIVQRQVERCRRDYRQPQRWARWALWVRFVGDSAYRDEMLLSVIMSEICNNNASAVRQVGM